MKKAFLILDGLVSVSLIVLLLGVSVNRPASNNFRPHATQIADGVPLPPPVNPPPKLNNQEVADGVPLPPPVNPPPKSNIG
jgi:hypothetical protein